MRRYLYSKYKYFCYHFYIVFNYYWFLVLQFNQYKVLLFIWLFIHQVLFFGFLVIIFVSLIVDLFLHWQYQRLLILKLFLGCDCKLLVGRIQTRHTDFLPPQVCGRLWRGFRLDIQTCSLQLIVYLDLRYPSSSSFKPSFVDFWLVCIIFIGSAFIDPETFHRMWL